jgi:hypothetical protein
VKGNMMQTNERYNVKQLSFDDCLNDLNNTSPLQMSKKLIEYELFDQQESIEVLNQIYEEFESNQNIVDELVVPVFFNITDSLVKHPKLGLSKTGITTTRLINEIKSFSYNETHQVKEDKLLDKDNLNKETINNTEKREYTKNRHKYDNAAKRKEYRKKYLGKKSRDEYTNKNNVAGKRPQTDHIVPLEKAVKEYGTSPFLSDKELKKVLNQDKNFAVTNGSLNGSKGGSSNAEAVLKNHTIAGKQSDKTKQKMIQKEQEAVKVVEGDLNQIVANNLVTDVKNLPKGESKLVGNALKDAKEASAHKAIGELLILVIKPLYYEFNDIFKNGILANLNTNDKVEAFIIRIHRVKNYILDNSVSSAFDMIKDFLKGFISFLINGIINAFIGLIKQILKVISEGFSSIIEAIKILTKDKDLAGNKITSSQKADAITKLLATTVITFLGAYFEESILGILNGTPFEFLKDIIMIMLTGVASTIVVWLLYQADILSVKDEKRMLRVKEIFQLRVQAIKENTDVFEKSSIETLTKQKLQFKKIASEMNFAITQNLNVNTSVSNMADFMGIELNVKSTNKFLYLLETNKELYI